MGKDNNITAQVDQICDAIRALLLAVAIPPEQEVNQEAEHIRRALEVIRAKDILSVPEAAILLNCSDSHLYNLIQKALDGTTEYPIPFVDLDGTQRLPQKALLEWSRTQKPKSVTPPEKNKNCGHLSIASSSRKKG